MNPPQSQQSFDGLGIAPNLLDALTRLRFTVPTPIQHKAIPIALSGKDIIGVAQTGTGKTLAFGVPMIQRLAQVKGYGLVLLPTRELAVQVEEVFRKIGNAFGLRTAVLIGGTGMGNQLNALRKKPHVVIATPGRLLDHAERRTIDLTKITVLVLDEADRMLDMGFAPQITKVLNVLPKERQIMLFSATMPREIVTLATKYMQLPLQIEVAPAGTLAERVEQEFFLVKKEDKIRLLEALMTQYHGTMLIFSRTKYGAKKICRSVNMMGHKAAEIHSNRTLGQRREALEGFKFGKYRILVATDIAARGIDVTGIEVVVNFDIPEDAEDYVHRIGRTGRAGHAGRAISFVAPDQRGKVRDIERFTRTSIQLSSHPSLPPGRAPEPIMSERPRRAPYQRSRRPQTRGSNFGHSQQSARPNRSEPNRTESSRDDRDYSFGNDHFFSRPKPSRLPRGRSFGGSRGGGRNQRSGR